MARRLRRREHEQYRAQREQANQDCLFFQLPVEIRLEVYKHAASKPRPAVYIETSRYWRYTPSMGNFRSRNPTLHVCRQMRRETLKYMLQDRTLVTYLDDSKRSYKWPRSIGLSDEVLSAASSFRLMSSYACRGGRHGAVTYLNSIHVDFDRFSHSISEMTPTSPEFYIPRMYSSDDACCKDAAMAKVARIAKEVRRLGLHEREVFHSRDLRKLARGAGRYNEWFENLSKLLGREGEGAGRLKKKKQS